MCIRDRNVLLWQDIKDSHEYDGKFQLIYHDMGNMTTRLFSLKTIIRWLAPNGLLILDDMHKRYYNIHTPQILAEEKMRSSSIIALTIDNIKRYAWVAKRETDIS